MQGTDKKHGRSEYIAKMEFSADTIRRLTTMQYNTFSFSRKLGQAASSVLLIAVGLFVAGPIGILSMAIGCFLIVSLNFKAKTTADKICKGYAGKLPNLSYVFYADGMCTSQVSDIVPYSRIIRMIDDGEYLYLYFNRATAFMVDKKTVNGDGSAEGLKIFLKRMTGMDWKKPFSIFKINISMIRDMLSMNNVDDGLYSGYRLDDRK